MARLYLFAEGSTEQTFADTVLKPHLANFRVYLQPPVLIAHARRGGKVHRGGGRKYLPMKNDIKRFLAQEKARDVFFTTMIDLYAIHPDFPGLADAEKLRHLPTARVQALEKTFADDIKDRRFLPYIQLHEYEAYLFSDPKCFEFFYTNHQQQITALQTIANSYTSPELINDGPETAPSKRIIQHLPDYAHAKVTEGSGVATLIGLDTIRQKCPHFNAWLTQLEGLAATP